MNFDSYISELLFEHDCVIIPGLGGFITNWAHASVHPVQHTFFPPSKKVSFNAGLYKNDGLLANFIAQQEQISFEKTLELIEDYVKTCQFQLENKKTVTINLVGRLQKDYEGNIQFWPDEKINWLNESYGLTKFVSPPVKRERTYKKPEQLFADRKPTGQKKEQKRISKAVWLVLPALILALWGFYNADLIRDIDTNYSGIGQFIKHSINERPGLDVIPTETTIEYDQATSVVDIIKEDDIPIDQTEAEEIAEPEEIAANTAINDDDEAKIPIVEVTKEAKIYFIVAGAFRSETNAHNLVANLRSKGFDSEIIDQTRSGLYRVIYKGFVLKSEALQDLASIREQDNPNAWLLKKQ